MNSLVSWGGGLLAWIGAIWGCLQVHRIDLGHSICGPWGCGPTTSAVFGWHGLWLVVILPLGILITRVRPEWNWRRYGLALVAVSAITALGIGVYDFFAWQQNPAAPVYVLQRFLFKLAIMIDVPVAEVGILGLAMAYLLGRGTSQNSEANSELT